MFQNYPYYLYKLKIVEYFQYVLQEKKTDFLTETEILEIMFSLTSHRQILHSIED